MAGNEHPPESKLGSPIGFGSISLIVIGVVMIVIGIIFMIIYQNQDKPWWVWAILIIGIAFGLLGAVILVFWLSYKPKNEELCYSKPKTIETYPSQQYYDGSQRYYPKIALDE
jgi:hypothetical protein